MHHDQCACTLTRQDNHSPIAACFVMEEESDEMVYSPSCCSSSSSSSGSSRKLLDPPLFYCRKQHDDDENEAVFYLMESSVSDVKKNWKFVNCNLLLNDVYKKEWMYLVIILLASWINYVSGQPYANNIMFSKVVHHKPSLEKDQLMIVVGEVTDTSARILYEWAPSYVIRDLQNSQDVSLFVDVKKRIETVFALKSNIKMYKQNKDDFEFIYLMMTEQERLEWTKRHTSQYKIVLRRTDTRTVVNGKDIHGQVVEVKDREGPKVLQFNSLIPNTCYTVEFIRLESVNEDEDYATFCTISTDPFSLTSNVRIAAMSCDRLFEDEDLTTFDEFYIDHQNNLWDYVIHLGDQVYADWVYHEYAKKINPDATFDDLVNAFRYVYRNTWKYNAVQRILRHGSHLMIPDDHDIINNLDRWMMEQDNQQQFKRMILAGKEVFYEYQYQLIKDSLVAGSRQELISNEPIYYFRDIGIACIALLDLRFERTFNEDATHPLFGSKQLRDLQTFLSTCMNNENRSIKIKRALIFTSIPILFFGDTFSSVVYAAEKERYTTHPDFKQDVIDFLDYLSNTYGTYRIVFVGGDIHQFLKSRICKSPDQCFEQLITSGMTIASTVSSEFKIIVANLVDFFFFANPTLNHWYLVRKTNNEDEPSLQHSIRRNYGVIEIKPDGNIALLKGTESRYYNRRDHLVQLLFDKGSAFVLGMLIFLSGFVFPISVIVYSYKILRFLYNYFYQGRRKEHSN